MDKHKFTITISGTQEEAAMKVQAIADLAAHLSADTLKALAHVVMTDPGKVSLAKRFLNIR